MVVVGHRVVGGTPRYMDAQQFDAEDRKYSELWRGDYKDARWGRLATRLLKYTAHDATHSSLIDFGFGRGAAMDFFERRGVSVAGTEISSYAVQRQRDLGRTVYHASLDNLSMIETGAFQIGFCNDVIEHVPEELVELSLTEMARVCSDFLFLSVCPKPAHHPSPHGGNLHLTVRPRAWWVARLKGHGRVRQFFVPFSRSLRFVIDLREHS